MALKKDGDRIKLVLTVNKKTDEKLRNLANKTNRPLGRMLDEIVERYEKDS